MNDDERNEYFFFRLQNYLIDIVKMGCNLLRAAILTQNNVEKEFQWPHYSTSKQSLVAEMISFWLPHCIRLVQSMYSSFVSMEMANDSFEQTSKLLLDMR